MPPVTSRKWDYAVIGFILLIASLLLFVPPIVGVADSGDYYRLTARVGLEPPPGLYDYNHPNCWIIQPWNIVPAQPFRAFSTGEFPVWAAILLNKVADGSTTLDIRWVAGVNLALLSGLILAILRSARKLPAAAYFIIAAGLILVCTDSQYLSYFNSFYGESAALLGVFAFVAAGLAVVMAGDPSWLHMATLVLATAFLAGSKPQNAVLGVFAAVWMVWLFKGKAARRYASLVAGLALVSFIGFVITRAVSPESNLYNAIYDRVLPNSLDPPRTLVELGLKPETATWKGVQYWEVRGRSQFAAIFPGKATRFRLLGFYLRHPSLDLRMARQALSFNNDVPYLGNYTKDSGAPCETRTQASTEYDRFRMHLASVWFLFPLLAANVAAVFLWRDRMAGLLTTLGIMTAFAFLLGAFYDNEPRKHLFTFNLLFDVLLFADLSVGAARLAPIRDRLPVFGSWGGWFGKRSKVAIAFVLLAIVGIAVWFDAISKDPPGGSGSNLALDKPAAQSSTYPSDSSAASSAVDGRTDGYFNHGSVTSTNQDTNAWWQVDLGASKSIGSIVIWNRTDCCSSRLSGYWVFISNTPFSQSDIPATLQNRAGIWSSYQTTIPDPSTTIATPGAKGRYVRVQLNGTDYLSLAEVQVSPFGPNLAVGKPATQSSTLPGYSTAGAGAAVDGNTGGGFFQGSVTSTNSDPNAWWQVDLGASSAIGSIVIWNRSDCCLARLSDYWVFASDTPFSPSDTPATLQKRAGTWKSHQTKAPDPSTAIKTAGARGRYVRVQLAGTDYLSLAEVQVFGQ